MSKKYKGKEVYNRQMEEIRIEHKQWREKRRDQNSPFFMIYTDFKDIYLKEISGGALKLYLYLGFHVNTFTGECWHSVDSIAEFFRNDPRTVKKWFEELEERGMVKRIQSGYKRIANTFLLPYGGERTDE